MATYVYRRLNGPCLPADGGVSTNLMHYVVLSDHSLFPVEAKLTVAGRPGLLVWMHGHSLFNSNQVHLLL